MSLPFHTMGPKRKVPYAHQHGLLFGVEVCERCKTTGEVVSARCRFCVSFGREEKAGGKRKRTQKPKYYTKPFRTDNYTSHNSKQHPSRWQDYNILSDEKKATYFDDNAQLPLKSTLYAHFDGVAQLPLVAYINRPIVDVIIKDMLFHPDDSEGISMQRALEVFQDTADASEGPRPGDTDRYKIEIRNPLQFGLIVDFIRLGSSFRQAHRILESMRTRTGMATIGTCSRHRVSTYTRFTLAMNLQKICELLQNVWAFSLAMDMSTHMSSSYLDIRIRVCWSSKIHNFHLLAIPMPGRHTAEAIFNAADQAMTALCPDWKAIIVGISTDGEKKMTGRIQGANSWFTPW